MRAETLTISGLLAETRQLLKSHGIPDPALEARSLVRAALNISHTELLTDPERQVDPESITKLNAYVERRILREPLQYITGKVEFYGREFAVDNRVLIPRPETELLIEQALLRIRECHIEAPQILDNGTGSGILAVTMATEMPSAQVVAVDVSYEALDLARTNSGMADVAERIDFVSGSITDVINRQFDVVLCNPPYVLTGFLDGPEAQPELAYEPRLALDGGDDGMTVYNQILPELAGTLKTGGAAYFEIDPPVTESCLNLAKRLMPEASISVVTDLAGLERCMAIELHC